MAAFLSSPSACGRAKLLKTEIGGRFCRASTLKLFFWCFVELASGMICIPMVKFLTNIFDEVLTNFFDECFNECTMAEMTLIKGSHNFEIK